MKRTESPSQPVRRALGLRAAASYLSLSPATLRRIVANGDITPSRLSKRLLFDIRDLDALLERGKQS